MRDDVIRFRATKDEREMIERLAAKDGLSRSDVVRMAVRRAHAEAFEASKQTTKRKATR